jgi:hypothetical protein
VNTKAKLSICLFLAVALLCCLNLQSVNAVSVNTPTGGQATKTLNFSLSDIEYFNETVISYLWNFGDSTATTTTTIPYTSHIYSVAGTYLVNCTVTVQLEVWGDWNVSTDWVTTESFSASVTVLPSNAQNSANTIVSNMYIAVGLIGISLIVLAASLIMIAIKSGDADNKLIFGGLIVLIASIIILVVGFSIVAGLEGAINNALVLALII